MVHRSQSQQSNEGYGSQSEELYDAYPQSSIAPTRTAAGLASAEADSDFATSGNGSGLGEDVERKMAHARERLDQLRHEQERVEAEERHLERLRLRQEEFLVGSREAHDQLQKSVAKLDRDIVESERHLEAARVSRETLGRHLEAVRGLAPERWADDQIEDQLERALVVLEDARTDFERCDARLAAMPTATVGARSVAPLAGGQGLDTAPLSLFKVGFFLTLPLIIGLALVALYLVLNLGA